MPPKNDWNEYKRLILQKMEDDEKRWDRMFEIVGSLRSDVAGLKAKALIAGGAAGIVATGIISLAVQLWK